MTEPCRRRAILQQRQAQEMAAEQPPSPAEPVVKMSLCPRCGGTFKAQGIQSHMRRCEG